MSTFFTALKTRLLKLDSLHGLVLIIFAAVLLYILYYSLQHLVQAFAVIFAATLLIEGFRKIASDPVKAAVDLDLAKAKLWAESELGYDPTGVISPPTAAAANVVTQPASVTSAAALPTSTQA